MERPQSADVLWVNGKFITLDQRNSVCQAVAVADGRIVRAGTVAEVRASAGPTAVVVDLGGLTVLPGFIDGHAHPSLAIRMIEKYVDGRFASTPSISVLLPKIADRAAKTTSGEWIIVAGSSSSQTRFAERRVPTREELDSVAPHHPVMFLNGAHEGVVNSAGLRALGIARDIGEHRGAQIVLDGDGEPTGVIRECMAIFPDARIPEEELRRYYATNIPAMWNASGYTSVYAFVPFPQMRVLHGLAGEAGPPTLRYTVAVHADPGGKALPAVFDDFAFPEGSDPDRFRFSGIKVWADSDVPIRGGAVSEPYAGPENGHGILNMSQEEMDALAVNCARAGQPLLIHATGDRATAMALTAFERAQAETGLRPLQRIEHFGDFMLGPDDLGRAKRLGVAVNVQPAWLTTLAKSTMANLGAERARGAFRFRSMIDAGLEPGAGTDLTGIVLETLNPFLHLWAAVTRQSDAGPFVPEEAISVTEALSMMTRWAARAQGEDDRKGSIEAGKLADMVILSDDITSIDPMRIRDLKVLKTIVGGRVVYDHETAGATSTEPGP